MNQINLIGRLGKEPDIRQFENGKIANFSLAVSEKYTNRSGEKIDHTEWFNVCVVGKSVEVIEKYVHRGDLLRVTGKIKTRKYTDKDGIERSIMEVISSDIGLLPNERKTEAGIAEPDYYKSQQSAAAVRKSTEITDDDDLPF